MEYLVLGDGAGKKYHLFRAVNGDRFDPLLVTGSLSKVASEIEVRSHERNCTPRVSSEVPDVLKDHIPGAKPVTPRDLETVMQALRQ